MKTLLTGSTRGIGAAIRDLLVENRYSVIGTSRSRMNDYTNNEYIFIYRSKGTYPGEKVNQVVNPRLNPANRNEKERVFLRLKFLEPGHF
jgi:nucleoside-diphosphate-sugar epimerase